MAVFVRLRDMFLTRRSIQDVSMKPCHLKVMLKDGTLVAFRIVATVCNPVTKMLISANDSNPEPGEGSDAKVKKGEDESNSGPSKGTNLKTKKTNNWPRAGKFTGKEEGQDCPEGLRMSNISQQLKRRTGISGKGYRSSRIAAIDESKSSRFSVTTATPQRGFELASEAKYNR
ncbi:13138_t:CDS:2 [Acaulospora colombiana]|uniref:13138_t:CDS:1 n=1 Tax=Acaulospora colombiana TaxID=27376 RepID=A0ACA9NP79_9GLOM|nr:13138_t:CDS:2 [Acaulospora colombiana]